jgi:hypothetical protein
MTQSYFPSAACGVTEPAKALRSVLVHLYNRWPLEGKKRIALFNVYTGTLLCVLCGKKICAIL